ncbi:MAG TPA: Glu/Leu/Phe/Val dehydrogenase dimerization domain-containing protein [Candidatus Methylomirabilis sp.]|nr:Glu/Leu/Phe/Val dehydrogenase dimerization domain-containing protein [Candidatus Methylomirabilis sp.]
MIEQRIGDDLGPAKVLVLRDPRVGLDAIVVVDNVACGPAIGGVRMASDVTLDEVRRLARAMTFKNAAAGLAHGGGKSGIVADPACAPSDKERLVRVFARMIRGLTEYIPGPDMGTSEVAMAWVKDEIDRAVGLPRVFGGIPLDEIGATGFGLAVAAEVAADEAKLSLSGARVAVEGFGAVGQHGARFLAQRGARLVAASDSRGAIENPAGLDIDGLVAHKRSGRPVASFPGGRPSSRDDLVGVECDIWIPAARPDSLTRDNVARLTARLVLQGANIPATAEAEEWMYAHGVVSVPDFVANAGGVICAAVEYHGGTQAQAFAVIDERIRSNTIETLERARTSHLLPRQAAIDMARSRIEEAMRYRAH